jgi:hypothetical protein
MPFNDIAFIQMRAIVPSKLDEIIALEAYIRRCLVRISALRPIILADILHMYPHLLPAGVVPSNKPQPRPLQSFRFTEREKPLKSFDTECCS